MNTGQIKHILRLILLNGGMFNGKGEMDERRQDRFETFLAAVWWPGSVSRLPKKVFGFINIISSIS
jgi:hypothetical protein